MSWQSEIILAILGVLEVIFKSILISIGIFIRIIKILFRSVIGPAIVGVIILVVMLFFVKNYFMPL